MGQNRKHFLKQLKETQKLYTSNYKRLIKSKGTKKQKEYILLEQSLNSKELRLRKKLGKPYFYPSDNQQGIPKSFRKIKVNMPVFSILKSLVGMNLDQII